MSKRILIDLFDGTEELDAVGPWEVLSYWTQAYPEDGWRVDLVTDDASPAAAPRDSAWFPPQSRPTCPTQT